MQPFNVMRVCICYCFLYTFFLVESYRYSPGTTVVKYRQCKKLFCKLQHHEVIDSHVASDVQQQFMSDDKSTAASTTIASSLPSATLFTALSAIAVAVSYADRSNLSTAIIPMSRSFGWDSLYSGLVLSAFWLGYALTQVLGGRLSDKFGGEKVLAFAIIAWSTCTFLTPIASATNVPAVLLGIRVLLGAGEGLALPSIHGMLQKYVPAEEQTTSAAIITSACYLGALISNLLSPLIIEKYNWESIFYLFALIPPLLWLPTWYSTFIKQTKYHAPVVVVEELTSTVERMKTINLIPKLLKRSEVWAIIIAQYCSSWGMIGLLSWLPTFYSQKFDVPVASLGSFTTLPYLFQMVVAVLSGRYADRLISSGVRVLKVRNAFQLVGMIVPAMCLYYCSHVTDLSATMTAAIITLGSTISALTVSAVSCNHFDIAPKHAGTVFGIGNTASCLGGLIAVPISGYIYDVTHSWDSVFFLFALHYLGGALGWALLASDKPMNDL